MSEKPVAYKKTCPWCHGSGKAQGTPSTWEMLNGGLCGKCSGTGEVEELIWVKDSPPDRNAYAASSSSDEGNVIEGIAGIIGAIIGGIFLTIKLGKSYETWKENQPTEKRNQIENVQFILTIVLFGLMALYTTSNWDSISVLFKIGGICAWLMVGMGVVALIFPAKNTQ